jgi:hypothetical protein
LYNEKEKEFTIYLNNVNCNGLIMTFLDDESINGYKFVLKNIILNEVQDEIPKIQLNTPVQDDDENSSSNPSGNIPDNSDSKFKKTYKSFSKFPIQFRTI